MAYYQPFTLYDSVEWTTGTETNYDISGQSTAFVNCKNPKYIVIRADQNCTIRLNSTTNPAITINANTQFNLDMCISAVYVTTTGATAIKILLQE